MNCPVIIALRVLAIGSALAAITCQVANRQQLADAGYRSGDRGASGPAAPPSAARPTWASSSKSLDALVSPLEVSSKEYSLVPSGTATPRKFIAGTKSAAVLSPDDVAQVRRQSLPAPPPPAAPQPAISDAAAKDEVKRLFGRGVGFYDLGQIKNAEAEFQRVVAGDPANTAAQRYLERCRALTAKPAPSPPNTTVPAVTSSVRPAAPRYLPGSKSARMVTPEDLRQMQQRVDPKYRQAPAQQSAAPQR